MSYGVRYTVNATGSEKVHTSETAHARALWLIAMTPYITVLAQFEE